MIINNSSIQYKFLSKKKVSSQLPMVPRGFLSKPWNTTADFTQSQSGKWWRVTVEKTSAVLQHVSSPQAPSHLLKRSYLHMSHTHTPKRARSLKWLIWFHHTGRVSMDQKHLWSIFSSRVEVDSVGCAFPSSTWHLPTFCSVSQPCSHPLKHSHVGMTHQRSRLVFSESVNYLCLRFSFPSVAVLNVFHFFLHPGLFQTVADCFPVQFVACHLRKQVWKFKMNH